MPSSITHAYFSIDVFNKLPKIYQQKIDINYLKIFSQGSDPFMFYNFLLGKKAKNSINIQSTIHTKNTNLFFKNTITYINNNFLNNNKEILSFLYGFIAHYYLDLYTHPFIYYKSGIFNKKDKSTHKYNCLHQKYEYLIDLYFIKTRENIPYYKFKPHIFLFSNYKLSNNLLNLIDNIMYQTYKYNNLSKHYEKSLKFMYLFYKHINYDPYSIKLFLYKIIDKFTDSSTTKFNVLSFHNKILNINNILNTNNLKWTLPFNKSITSTSSFLDLYNLALEDTINTIIKITDMLDRNKIDNNLLNKLFKNKSLITGINCEKKVIMKYFEF